MKILIADDDADLTDVTEYALRREGHAVVLAYNGEQALTHFYAERPDVVLLDIGIPQVDGFEVVRRMRETSNVPVIMVTARDSEWDMARAFDLGADDYVTKPFSPREVTARVRVVLRRSRGQVQPPPLLRADTLILDLEAHTATQADQPLDLTPTEFDILTALMRHPGQAFTRLQLVEASQGGAYEGYERVIDQHIKNLRAKLGDDARAPRFIETVFGVGYRFSAEFRHDA